MSQPIEQLTRRTVNFIRKHTYTRYVYFSTTREKQSIPPNSAYAIVHLDAHALSNDMGRYAYILCTYLERAGFKLVVRTPRQYYESITAYKKPLLQLKAQFVRETGTPTNSVELRLADGRTKTIQFKYGFNVLQEAGYDCVAPYPMHPNLYEQYPSADEYAALRAMSPKIHMLFSGNVEHPNYKRKAVEQTFGVANRYSLLQIIKERFEKSGMLVVANQPGQLEQLLAQDSNNNIVINEAKTEMADWLPTLAQTSFFICPPGMHMPWCHNLIEAMSVGCIPVMQYAHLMQPQLQHGKNCLAFADTADLERVLHQALAMPPETVAQMRRAVIDYFEEHLSVHSIIRRIKGFCAADVQKVQVAIPYIYKIHKSSGQFV